MPAAEAAAAKCLAEELVAVTLAATLRVGPPAAEPGEAAIAAAAAEPGEAAVVVVAVP